jgi:hypothetical protein
MAIELSEKAGGKVVWAKVSEKLHKEDYEQFVPEIDRVVEANGKIRIGMEMHDFHGWDLSAMWEDTKVGLRHFSDIERIALVGETRWEQGIATFCKPFYKATVRYFDTSQADEAHRWLEEGLAV